MNYIKSTSWFLGISMFMFGFLKFFNPFKEWYSVQVSASELGQVSYVMGIAGELFTGIAFMAALLFRSHISQKAFYLLLTGASSVVIVMMVVAVYVHVHPAVPHDVLPLKIKPPYIPVFFLLLGALVLTMVFKRSRNTRQQPATNL